MQAKLLMPLRFIYFCDIQKLSYILIVLLSISCKPDSAKNNSEEPIIKLESPKDSMITATEIMVDSLPVKPVDNLPDAKIIEANNSTQTPPIKPKPIKRSSIYFENNIYQFSRMTEGDTLNHTFVFENRGNAPLIIKDVTVDCGCTVPDYSSNAIAPGEKGSINVTFNSKGKIGMQEREITILTNGKPMSTVVILKGIVDTD